MRPAPAVSAKAARRLASLDPRGSVFAEYTALANAHGAVNLGQGFPTLPVPAFITAAATKAVAQEGLMHQYTRSEGHVRLAKALSDYYVQSMGRTLNPLTEILTTVGASEAISSIMQAFLDPGDEVILFQPYYDCYPAAVTLAGGVPVVVSLRPQATTAPLTSHDWKLDTDEIRSKVKPGITKMILINNPHNPIGKVFTREELEAVAKIATEFDLLVLADEVYETLVYEDSVSPLIKFASLPGMYERTVTVGSVGKMFGVTGWKIGWALGSPEITRAIWLVHQFVPFAVATPLQEAAAACLDHAASSTYFADTVTEYAALRDRMMMHLKSVGLPPTLPHGGYFILADTSRVPDDTSAATLAEHPRRDYRVCNRLTIEAGVTAIPPSAFYDPNAGSLEVPGRLARFAFCKSEEMIDDAGGKLAKYFSSLETQSSF
ncbi:Kynurenine--oxoglutarate transaminase 3 [Thoreauomyces humboldtii]|nr:Kynurenine--oxoglutarate transaminase 3 [Thoreauomyces humboldtii]